MASQAQNDWIGRVLRVEVGPGAAAGGSIKAAAAAWRAASDAIDQQIAHLQAALRSRDDDELHEIAEFGLNGITGNHKVRLMAALVGAEAGDARAMATLRRIVLAFRQHIETDERVGACDENPFGVKVRIRDTLAPAFDQLLAEAG